MSFASNANAFASKYRASVDTKYNQQNDNCTCCA